MSSTQIENPEEIARDIRHGVETMNDMGPVRLELLRQKALDAFSEFQKNLDVVYADISKRNDKLVSRSTHR